MGRSGWAVERGHLERSLRSKRGWDPEPQESLILAYYYYSNKMEEDGVGWGDGSVDLTVCGGSSFPREDHQLGGTWEECGGLRKEEKA